MKVFVVWKEGIYEDPDVLAVFREEVSADRFIEESKERDELRGRWGATSYLKVEQEVVG